jgi:aspartyl-tRNA synthetase
MAFVEQEDILNMFESLVKRIFKDVKQIDYHEKVERMTWEDACGIMVMISLIFVSACRSATIKKPTSVYVIKLTKQLW